MASSATVNASSYPINSRPIVASFGPVGGALGAGIAASSLIKDARLAKVISTSAAMAQQTANPGLWGALKSVLSPMSWLKSLKWSALFSLPIAFVSNFMDYEKGNITPTQLAGDTLADAAGYTVAGTAGGLAGAFIGCLFPVPFLGPVLGMLVGGGLSFLYDQMVRPKLQTSINAAMAKLTSPSSAPATSPAPGTSPGPSPAGTTTTGTTSTTTGTTSTPSSTTSATPPPITLP